MMKLEPQILIEQSDMSEKMGSTAKIQNWQSIETKTCMKLI
jgi:hypothetical protein